MKTAAGQKIMVTGASGFLGSHLRARLLAEGAEVHGVSRVKRQLAGEAVRWWQGDMADIGCARRLFREIDPDTVFHLSGLATASPERDLVLPTLHTLLVSTVNVLVAASEARCRRVILAASLTEPQPDRLEITPGSPYAAAKWASGAYARMFHRLYALPVIMVRPFMTYGPGQNERKLVPHVILSLLNDRAPKLSSGSQLIDWIYIDDVIDGFLAAAEAQEVEGETIDLGSGSLISIREVVEQISALVGARIAPQFHAVPDRPAEPVRVADMHAASVKLGWQPRTSLQAGLAQTIDWYSSRSDRSARL